MEGKFMCVEYGVRDGVWVGVTLPFTTRKNSSVPAEFQQNIVDITSWFRTLDSDNF
jgi:hypothetical protein